MVIVVGFVVLFEVLLVIFEEVVVCDWDVCCYW